MKLQDVEKLVSKAKCPEDVFGTPYTADHLKKSFRVLARVAHPDRFKRESDRKLATAVFAQLSVWHTQAEEKLAKGVYGVKRAMYKPVRITTKKGEYLVETRTDIVSDICDVFEAHGSGDQLWIPRSPADNMFMKNEAEVLKVIKADKSKMSEHHIPTLLDTFELQMGKVRKQVNVFKSLRGYVSLQQVIDAYPGGIHVLDAAWMFNRVLAALMCAHAVNVVHGNVTPATVYVCPDNPDVHNGKLIDWTRAVRVGGVLKSINPKYRGFYPPEVFTKRPLNSGADIYMAARCLVALIGGNGNTGELPVGTHHSLRGLLRACSLGALHRVQSAYEVHEDFKQLTGPRKFRPFAMPIPGKA